MKKKELLARIDALEDRVRWLEARLSVTYEISPTPLPSVNPWPGTIWSVTA
jgi:hypothetical protein